MRTFDAAFLNEIANRPHIRPRLDGEGPIDLQPALNLVRNMAFVNEQGGYVLLWRFEGVYEIHTIFDVQPGMFKECMKLAKKAQEYMFFETDCTELVTKVPPDNPGAGNLARYMGLQEQWNTGGTGYCNLPLDRWARACSTARVEGKAFHEAIEKAKELKGSELPIHPDDPVHDHVVGAAVLMIKAGNLAKGLNFYNRWASFAGYGTVTLLSEQPVVVDIQDAVVGLVDGKMEVLVCR